MNHTSTLSGPTGFFDFRFLNPFKRDTNNIMIGTRYGYGQFIIFFSYIIIILLTIKNYKSPYAAVTGFIGLSLMWWSVYYGISCIFIPNNVERCFLGQWIFTILPVLIISIILMLYMIVSTIGNMTGGNKKKNKTMLDKAKDVANDVSDKVTNYFKGGNKTKKDNKRKKKKTAKKNKKTTVDKLMDGAIDYFT